MDIEQSEYYPTENNQEGDHALHLKFSIGYTSSMIGAVNNLTYEDKKVTFNNKLKFSF